ncbi:hypothetical protein ACMHYB_58785 [Sorangium sp. So ce1128]
MSLERPVTPATLTPQTGPNAGDAITVHFNPASLQYQVSNTLERRGQGNAAKQYVSQSTAKLTMDLVFDTTISGEDVRSVTQRLARMMEPAEEDNDKVPAIVSFEWGAYEFQGMMEQYKETLDFFSPEGVPLRSTINLTLAAQDEVFAASGTGGDQDTSGSLTPDAVSVPPSQDADATTVAARGGNPRAGRSVAAANGLESLRSAAGRALTFGTGPSLRGPAAFASGGVGAAAGAGFGVGIGGGGGASFGASAGAGFGASAGAGFGASAGAGFGASAGAGFGASAGAAFGATSSSSGGAYFASTATASGAFAGVSASAGFGGAAFGAQASAGVPASLGAFAGLRAAAPESARGFDARRLLPRAGSAQVSTGAGADFDLGGRAMSLQGSGLSADVGRGASLRARIRFEEG